MARINTSDTALALHSADASSKSTPRADQPSQPFDAHLRNAGHRAKPADDDSSHSAANDAPTDATADSSHGQKASSNSTKDASNGDDTADSKAASDATKSSTDSQQASPNDNPSATAAAVQSAIAQQVVATKAVNSAKSGDGAVVSEKADQDATTPAPTNAKPNGKATATANAQALLKASTGNSTHPEAKSAEDSTNAQHLPGPVVATKPALPGDPVTATKSDAVAAVVQQVAVSQQNIAAQQNVAAQQKLDPSQLQDHLPQNQSGKRIANSSRQSPTASATSLATKAIDAAHAVEAGIQAIDPTAAITAAADHLAVALTTTAADGAKPASTATNDSSPAPTTKAADNSAAVAGINSPQIGHKNSLTTGGEHATGKTATLSAADRARLVQRVSRAFQSFDSGGGQMRLRLSPPELGSVKLDVTVRDGQMSARLEAENETTRNLLIDNLPQLRERLSEQGITIDRFDVDLMNQSSGQPRENLDSREQRPQSNPVAAVASDGRRSSAVDSAEPRSARVATSAALDVLI